MSQIMYNYPAMLAHAADMAGYAGTLQGLGADIASEQAALQAGWQGDTGMSYQAWQAQWNQAMEQLVLAYRAMAGTHENKPLRCWPATKPRAPNGAASRPRPISVHSVTDQACLRISQSRCGDFRGFRHVICSGAPGVDHESEAGDDDRVQRQDRIGYP